MSRAKTLNEVLSIIESLEEIKLEKIKDLILARREGYDDLRAKGLMEDAHLERREAVSLEKAITPFYDMKKAVLKMAKENQDKMKVLDTPMCQFCGGRTATGSGTYYFTQDENPYKEGVKEEAVISESECHVSGFICDKCERIQGLFIEGQ